MRLALRSLYRSPGLSAVVIATLSVAFAFIVACAGLLNGLLLHPYGYPRLGDLLLVRDSKPREGAHQGHAIAAADFQDARSNVQAFSSLAGWRPQPIVVTRAAADAERIEGAAVTANFFSTLGVTPLVGRLFASDADVAGRDGAVILSRRIWSSRFGAAPSIVGSEIHVNGRAATVVGIIRDEDCYPSGVDAWLPLVFTPAELEDRAAQRVAAIARLASGRTVSEARGQLTSLAATLAARYPTTNRGRAFEVMPLPNEQFEFTAPLFGFVQGAALLVLVPPSPTSAIFCSHGRSTAVANSRSARCWAPMRGASPASPWLKSS
jgi:putative ABC transport system permease protein